MTEKINLGKYASIYPMPVALVGANVEGRPDFMTVAWVSRVNSRPAIMAVAL
jgi:flavin reductase (DIM6/NTAB) family NADH-FMN oxidoreductase RutF